MRNIILLIVFNLSIFFIAQAQTPTEKLAQQYLRQQAPTLGLTPSDIAKPIVTDQYTDSILHMTHLYWQQQYADIPIYNAQTQFAIDPVRGSVRNFHCNFIPQLDQVCNTTQPTLSPQSALDAFVLHLKIPKATKRYRIATQQNDLPTRPTTIAQPSFAASDVQLQLYYVPVARKKVRLAWNINFRTSDGNDWWNAWVDAQNGDILQKNNWSVKCQWDSPHSDQHLCSEIHLPQSPTPAAPAKALAANDYNVFAMPVESPNHGSRSIVNSPWTVAGNAGTLGWHNTGTSTYTTTRGNNVWATEDQNADDVAGYSPTSATLDFNYPLNLANAPQSYQDAAITNLFYWCNLMHDIVYQYGFDELSGNFQQNNLNRGGWGSDYVVADAQDGSGTNNANFQCPPDGSLPRLQMYEWAPSSYSQVTVNTPSAISGSYLAATASFGGSLPSAPSSLNGQIVLATDNSANPTLICNALNNAAQVNGKIAMADRASCNFTVKVKNAQNAGAIAVIICNNVAGSPFSMSGSDNTITIPAIMLSLNDCNTIKVQLNAGATVSASLNTVGSNVNKDGDLDNGIICHEYAHGISIRLTGGPSNADCLSNAEQMGEGWSDWYGTALTMKSSDVGTMPRPVGTYASSEPTSGTGIRPAPYCTDMAINDYTYADLCNSEITVPHGVGFIWATMLWDLTWALIDEYGFNANWYTGTAGNNKAMMLITEAMKLQPCTPGFVDGRDAILLADELLYNGANRCLIWNVFAQRGLGYSASQGSSNDRCDGTAAFDKPQECSQIFYIEQIPAPTEAVPIGDTVTFTLIAHNQKTTAVTNVAINTAIPTGFTYVNNSASNSGTITGGTQVSFPAFNMAAETTATRTFKARVTNANYSQFLLNDNAESVNANWATSSGSGSASWVLNTDLPRSGSKAWFAQNLAAISDFYLTSQSYTLPATGNTELRFWHYYSTEADWDGGVVEISSNDGASWSDLGSNFTQNGYNSTIADNPASAISTREAFTGNSNGYKESIVNLAPFAGQTIKIRFRFAADEYVSGLGWYIDDIKILQPVTLSQQTCATTAQSDSSCDTDNWLILEGTLTPPCVGFSFQLSAQLEGAYIPNSNTMRTQLRALNLLPAAQPYNQSPWNYTGVEYTNALPTSTVDWVLVELRRSTDQSIVARRAAILLNNGIITNSASGGVDFDNVSCDEPYFVVLRHRNHLPVITPQAIDLENAAIDFRQPAQVQGGTAQLSPVGSSYALRAGNANADSAIDTTDESIYLNASSGITIYTAADYNMDGYITVADYNKWKPNNNSNAPTGLE